MPEVNTQPFVTPVVGGEHSNQSASALIKTGDGHLIGIHVNSTTSGTLKLWDNTAASGTVIVNTFTPSVGWNAMPFHFKTGLYVTIGGTIDYTPSYR